MDKEAKEKAELQKIEEDRLLKEREAAELIAKKEELERVLREEQEKIAKAEVVLK